jgi:hypothetical protein
MRAAIGVFSLIIIIGLLAVVAHAARVSRPQPTDLALPAVTELRYATMACENVLDIEQWFSLVLAHDKAADTFKGYRDGCMWIQPQAFNLLKVEGGWRGNCLVERVRL